SGDSELVRRVSSTDPDEQMPPPRFKKPLSPAEVGTLKRWIDQGAAWGKHWSLEKPVRPEPPRSRDRQGAAWVRNPIDAFVLARLEREGLKLSPEADKLTLIRRVTLDLTGLPPTPEEVDAFLRDQTPEAYERVVDRLLRSPRYGE